MFKFLQICFVFVCSSGLAASSIQQKIIPPRTLGEYSTSKFQKNSETYDLSNWTIEDKVGQLLMVGYRSQKQIESLKVGGVVLFSWNVDGGIDKTQKLVSDIKNRAAKNLKAPLFIATDQEGGRVLRIRKGMTPFPDAAALGAIQDPYISFQVGRTMGIELASVGLNMNFAPVLDLGNAKSFLGNRVWGASAEPATSAAVSFIRGQRVAGVVAVAKHYPGHGKTEVDSHFQLPKIMKTREQLFAEDLRPFKRAIGEGVLAFMTAHVEYPKIDRLPASLSKVFLEDILREDLGFKGLVITDDLEMDGIKIGSETKGYGDLALEALKAGSDMILLVWSKDRQKEIFERIRAAIGSGELSEAWLDAKVQRILSIKDKSIGLDHDLFLNPFWKTNLRRPESLELARQISERAIRWVAGPEDSIKKSLRKRWVDAWNVWVPTHESAEAWRDKRPQDRVRVYRAKSSSSSSFMNLVEKTLLKKDNVPLVLVTPPRREMSLKKFNKITRVMGKQAMRAERKPVLWMHQGPQPLRLKVAPTQISLGMISLNSESELSLEGIIDGL